MGKTLEFVDRLFEGERDKPIGVNGTCHDCGGTVELIFVYQGSELVVVGGALYKTERDKPYFKCMPCFEKEDKLTNFQQCEVFSRVCGYLRPTSAYNPGKKAEFNERQNFKFNG